MLDQRSRLGQFFKAYAMEHLCAKQIENSEADLRSIFGRIDVHPKRPLSKLFVDDVHHGFGDEARISVGRDDRGECFLNLLTNYTMQTRDDLAIPDAAS